MYVVVLMGGIGVVGYSSVMCGVVFSVLNG